VLSDVVSLPTSPELQYCDHTMKRDEEPDLSVLNPLPNTVSRALLDASHQRRVVDYAVEDLARGVRDRPRVWLSAVLRSRTLACAHFAGGAWVL